MRDIILADENGYRCQLSPKLVAEIKISFVFSVDLAASTRSRIVFGTFMPEQVVLTCECHTFSDTDWKLAGEALRFIDVWAAASLMPFEILF